MRSLFNKKNLHELVKYGLVGIAHNGLGYLVFLAITWLGVPPVIAVAFLYPAGAAINFFANKKWTFKKKSDHSKGEITRYIISLGLGYFLNLTLLHIFVNIVGLSHHLVQLVLVFFIAFILFLTFKFFVLSPADKSTNCKECKRQ